MPYPAQLDDFILRANETIAGPPVSPAAGEVRSVYANPRDVLDYGADWVVDRLGEFDVIILTVKTMKGNIYASSTGWPPREHQDALGPLVAAAHARGKKVYAAVNTLGDLIAGHGQADDRQKLNQDNSLVYPNINISPCVDSYKTQLETLLGNLVTNYDLDGVVLETLFYANIFGTTDTVGHPDCPVGTDWMRGTIRDYAADLAAVVRGVDPTVRVVVTSYPHGRNNVFPALDPAEWGHQDFALLAPVVDDILLAFVGTPWAHSDPYPWLTVISDFRAATGRDPWISLMVVDEWEYSPRFYRGIANVARQEGIAGFNLHTSLSTLGELGPALTRGLWEKISLIRFAR